MFISLRITLIIGFVNTYTYIHTHNYIFDVNIYRMFYFDINITNLHVNSVYMAMP